MDFFFSTICPSVGVVLSTLQLASPCKAVQECQKHQNLGPLNPVPLAVGFVNMFGWLIYSTALRDLYLIMSVFFGTLLSFWGCTTAISLLAIQQRIPEVHRMERLMIVGIFWWALVALAYVTIAGDKSTILFVMGLSTTVTSALYYCSPLSTLRLIITLKDASSLYLPMIFMNLLAAALWTSYGFFGTNNVWIYGPCGFALFVTIAQLLVKFCYYSPSSNNHKSLSEVNHIHDDPALQPAGQTDPLQPHDDGADTADATAALNSLMGMGLGGVGGVGGIGLPGLALVDLSAPADLQTMADATAHSGLGIVEALSDLVPAAASALLAAVQDVGYIAVSSVADTSARERAYSTVSVASNAGIEMTRAGSGDAGAGMGGADTGAELGSALFAPGGEEADGSARRRANSSASGASSYSAV